MYPCSRTCKFPPPGLLCYLPVVVEVEDVAVVGKGRLRHTVVECGLFHGRVYKMWAVWPPDHTLLLLVVRAPDCSIYVMGQLPVAAEMPGHNPATRYHHGAGPP